jgi:dTDP-4-dehydrorhamnose reductase
MTNVAVIGGNGQLGTDLVRVFGSAQGYSVSPLTHDEIDITDVESVRATLGRVRPGVVLNCAAFHRVDECEERPEDAMRVNALGALNVARACASLDALCVHISTDYVFGGEGRAPYTEDDPRSPINVYGVSKLAGEHLVAQACPRWLTVRVASLFGTAQTRAKRGNFVDAILAKASAGVPVKVVDNIRMSPTYTRDAARALEELIRLEVHGFVHLTNAGSCSWYEFASHIVACAGLRASLIPVPSSEYPARARRPADSSLSSLRTTDYICRLRPWNEALEAYLADRGVVAAPTMSHRSC